LKPSDLLIAKAKRFIKSAEILAEIGDFDSAVSRLYYAMFHTAQALLETLGHTYSSHRAVISAYGQHFAKTGLLDAQFHKTLVDAFNQRQLGDYRVDSGLDSGDVELLLTSARAFLAEAEKWLAANG
jgi:uncharacterized protein (UPF0332 family)